LCAADCNDGFQFGYLVAGLRDVCGLQTGNFQYDGTRNGKANTSWVRYRGDLNIYYSEIVSLSLNGGANSQQLTRYVCSHTNSWSVDGDCSAICPVPTTYHFLSTQYRPHGDAHRRLH
jgi:hypothetical protein